jgi:hypothetical protein
MVRKIFRETKSWAALEPLVQCWSAGLAAVLILACDKSDDTSAQSKECERFCAQLERCDDGTDLLDCRKHCEADEVRSETFFHVRADCAQMLSCNLWVDEVDSQGDSVCSGECDLGQCVDRKLLDEKLSDEQQHSCTLLGSMVDACDPSYDATQVARDCEQISPLLSEKYREDSEDCVISGCGEIERCLDDLAERYETDLKVFSGSIKR